MNHVSRRLRSRTRLLLLAAVMALTVFTIGVSPAAAGPPDPTLNLTELQALLTASPDPLNGHMKTVLKGTTVTDIPVKILAIVEGQAWDKLIMIESTDQAIIDIGGIASGMSGSPVYVNDNGVDKLIGAVSWGADFSLRGTGMATPIEYMTSLQTSYAGLGAAPGGTGKAAAPVGKTVALRAPVDTASAGKVDSLVLARSAKTAAGITARSGQIVMHPLGLATIGGISPDSTAYKSLAARLERSGLTVMPAASAPRGGPPAPALEAGSPCGILMSSGAYSLAAFGTVTYVDDSTVLAFGHPILSDFFGFGLGAGPIGGTLAGAVVDGIWPSAASPSKLMSPADPKGAALQDRSAGVVARLGDPAPTYPITTDALVESANRHVVDTTNVDHWFSTVYEPEGGEGYGGAATFLATAGLYHALDTDTASGSATTTTSVVVNDGTDDYTITRDNLWDGGGEDALADQAAGDVADILGAVFYDPDGVRHTTVKSVDVDATFSAVRKSARLADVQLPRALRHGPNTVTISYYRWGSADLQTLDTTLTIPAGMPLSGWLSVMSAHEAQYYWDPDEEDEYQASPPETLAEIKERLEAAPGNDDLLVTFTPKGKGRPEATAQATTPTGWVMTGEVEKPTVTVLLRAPSSCRYGQRIPVSGVIPGASHNVNVDLYMQAAGSPPPATPTRTVVAHASKGTATFSAVLPPSAHNVTVTAEVGALSSSGLPGADQSTVKVRAALALSTRRSGGRLISTASVKPKAAGGSVRFQRYAGSRWVTFATVPVAGDGSARAVYKTSRATKVRARFMGSALNAASAWVTAPAR